MYPVLDDQFRSESSKVAASIALDSHVRTRIKWMWTVTKLTLEGGSASGESIVFCRWRIG
jgi:hypothetical protein